MIITFLAAASLSTGLAQAVPTDTRLPCSLHKLSACDNTNQLVWDHAFKRQVKKFAGKAQTNALGPSVAALSNDLIDTLGGPPEERVKLSDGNLLFTACVAHSCSEKGAIVLTPSGSIVVAAMLTNHLAHEGDLKWTRSDDEYSRLNFFVRDPVTGEPAWHAAIVDWAKAAHSDHRKVFEKHWNSRGLTETTWLVRPKSAKLQKLGSKKIVVQSAK